VCRVCGCTEADCEGCVKRTGGPCSWTSGKKDLCTACLPLIETDVSILFVVRDGVADNGRMNKLLAAGRRCVGHVQALDPAAPPKGLTREDVGDLREAADRWLKAQLAAGDPSYRCETHDQHRGTAPVKAKKKGKVSA
jgi:hypothetical protein